MRAVTASDGQPVVSDEPRPAAPGPGEIAVRVRAAGLNNADLGQAAGRYPAPADAPPNILGLELAGTVLSVGRGVERFAVGDEVMALVGGGAQAEVALFNERLAMAKPVALDWPEAGGFPEAFVTAHDALFSQCRLTVGERVLVHGAAGGVGIAAVQLAVSAGATVTATVRNQEMHSRVSDMGAVVLSPGAFSDAGPFDVVLELTTIQNMHANLRALATNGRISVIGLGTSGSVAPIDLGLLARRRGSICASTLRSRPLEGRADAVRRVERQVLPLVSAGQVRVPLTATYPLDRAPDAYRRFAAGSKFGKVVLDLGLDEMS